MFDMSWTLRITSNVKKKKSFGILVETLHMHLVKLQAVVPNKNTTEKVEYVHVHCIEYVQ